MARSFLRHKENVHLIEDNPKISAIYRVFFCIVIFGEIIPQAQIHFIEDNPESPRSSVGDPDPGLGLPDPGLLVRGTDLDPAPDLSFFHKSAEQTEIMLDKIEF